MQKGIEAQISAGRGVAEFIQRNRGAIFVSMAVLLLAGVGGIVALTIGNNLRGKANIAVEDLTKRYTAIGFDTIDETALGGEEVTQLLDDLRDFASGSSGYAGSRAWAMAANIYGKKGQWAEAEDAWRNTAKAGAGSHMEPVGFFNAAAATEEQGKPEAEAIALYEKSLSARAGFPEAPRAQFSVGRLNESLGNTDAALEAYRLVISGWPDAADWTGLANSRIISLQPGTQNPAP
jgi:tetratricopeptide (TPR) repeat protein